MRGSIRVSEKHGVNPSIVICFWCQKDRGEIALVGRLPGDKEAPRHIVTDYEPCDKCKELFSKGILMAACDENTHKPIGPYAVLKEEAVDRLVANKDLLQKIKVARRFNVSLTMFKELTNEAFTKEE